MALTEGEETQSIIMGYLSISNHKESATCLVIAEVARSRPITGLSPTPVIALVLEWPLTPKLDMTTWPFLKIDMRYIEPSGMKINISDADTIDMDHFLKSISDIRYSLEVNGDMARIETCDESPAR